ncbi:hypothetical protein J7K55_00890 [Candidatus Aerophobetes bacterium]|nr:hypothetical protein [Candidatus Aerophobetes bacterium]
MLKKLIPVSLVLLFILFFASAAFCLPVQDLEVITNEEYFPRIHQILREAKDSIQVMMFKACYYEKYPDSPSNILIQDLINAHQRGVKVEVILEKGNPKWSPTKKNEKVGRILSEKGISVVYDFPFITTHSKMLIIDSNISVVGSTNWAYYSLTQNNEVSVIIKSREVAKELQNYFKKIWNSSLLKSP